MGSNNYKYDQGILATQFTMIVNGCTIAKYSLDNLVYALYQALAIAPRDLGSHLSCMNAACG